MTIYLRTYLEEIRGSYEEARKEYVKIFEEADLISAKWNKARASKDLSLQGRNRAQQEYLTASAENKRKLETLISSTKKAFTEIRNKIDADFAVKFKVNSKSLDMPTLELLKSGILNDSELTELANKFSDNITMQRMIGKYARERAEKEPSNKEMLSLAISLENKENAPHLEAADTLIYWAESGLREDKITSDGINAVFDDNADRIIDEAGSISAEI